MEVKEKDLIKLCNSLIESGVQIRVFGLNYKPYYEDIIITDENVVRNGFINTKSGIAIDCRAIAANRLKVRTLTGFSRLFTKIEGEDTYRVNLVKDNKWVKILPKDYDNIAPGMLLIMKANPLQNIKETNLGMILDVINMDPEESISGSTLGLKVINESLSEVNYEVNLDDLDNPDPNIYILDRVLKIK